MTMAEGKKRQRPTVAQVKELEERIGTLEDEKVFLKTKMESQEKHYSYMAKELETLREEKRNVELQNEELEREVYFLRNRGFWARVFNR